MSCDGARRSLVWPPLYRSGQEFYQSVSQKVKMPNTTCSNAQALCSTHILLFLYFLSYLWSPSQELQCGPCYGPSDGAALRLRPDVHHREDYLRLLPAKVGGAALPSEPEGGGCHAQVQTPGQISGKGIVMHQPLGLLLQHLFTSWAVVTYSHKKP